jgi:hypothetical protein
LILRPVNPRGHHTDMDAFDQTNHAAEMTTRQLEQRCAKSAAKAGKLLTSAYAVLEADLPYFLELRQRLNAQGQRVRGIEGWQRWCEKHFSCNVRTVNRALAAILGPEKERPKPKRLRPVLDAYYNAMGPAILLARKHQHDPAASELFDALEVEELHGWLPSPKNPDLYEKLKDKSIRKPEIDRQYVYSMGVKLAKAVMKAPTAVRGDTPEGKNRSS